MPTYFARATAKQVEANRRNAVRSTGPRTEEGLAASSQNAVRHGLCARIVRGVNPASAGEDPAEYAALLEALRDDLQPAGQMECVLVERAAQLTWKLRRVPVAEDETAQRLIEPKRKAHERAEFKKRKTPFAGPSAGQLLGESFLGDDPGVFERIQVYEQRLERQLHGCLHQLRLLRKARNERGDDDVRNRSAELDVKFDGGEPRRDANSHESNSKAQHRSSGVSPVNPSPSSFCLSENKKEGRDDRTGETPGLRFCAPESIGDKSRAFTDHSSVSDENAGERTNPIPAEVEASSEVGGAKMAPREQAKTIKGVEETQDADGKEERKRVSSSRDQIDPAGRPGGDAPELSRTNGFARTPV